MYVNTFLGLSAIAGMAVFSLSSPPQLFVSRPPIPLSLENSWEYAQAWVDEGNAIAASKIYNESLKFASSLPTIEQQSCGKKVTKSLMQQKDTRPYKQLWADCLNGVNSNYANEIVSQQ